MKKWLNKQTITSFILGAILFITLPVFAETRTINALYNNIRLKINGIFIETDVEPFIVNGRTMVPARFVAESLGATVAFNDAENCVDIISNKTEQNNINYTNGDKYIGEIKNGLPSGKGIYYWSNGTYHIGEFVNGLVEGFGYFVFKDGSTLFCNWDNSIPVGNGYYVDVVGIAYSVVHKDGKVIDIIQLNSKDFDNFKEEGTAKPTAQTPTPSPELTRAVTLEYDNSTCVCGVKGHVGNRRIIYEMEQEYEIVDVKCWNPKCKLYNTIIGQVRWKVEYK